MKISGSRKSQAEETANVKVWMLDVQEEIPGQWSRMSQCPRSECRWGPEPMEPHIYFSSVIFK